MWLDTVVTVMLTDILKTEWGFRGFVESDWVFGVRSTVPSVARLRGAAASAAPGNRASTAR